MLIVEAPDDCIEAAGKILKDEMERAADMAVPLLVDMNVGKTWFDAKG